MRFQIIESRKRKLDDCIEGESFENVFDNIANIYDVEACNLKACCEIRRNIMRYVIFDGNNRIAILELVDN